jgi:hypothetical protein
MAAPKCECLPVSTSRLSFRSHLLLSIARAVASDCAFISTLYDGFALDCLSTYIDCSSAHASISGIHLCKHTLPWLDIAPDRRRLMKGPHGHNSDWTRLSPHAAKGTPKPVRDEV